MQIFYFEAADSLGRKISGTIKADSEDEAHKKLKSRDLAVFLVKVKIENEIQKNEKGDALDKYEFEAQDRDGKIIHGVIDAIDEGAAYKSLKVEYDFKVRYLVKSSLSEEEKVIKKEQGIDGDLRDWLKAELKYSDYYKKKKAEREKKSKRKEVIILSPAQQKELESIQNRISEVVASVSDLLKENEQYLDKNKKREIEDRLNLLSRLRQSNALDHLRSLTDKIIKQLTDDSIFLIKDIDKTEEGAEQITATKSKFKHFAKDFDQKIENEFLNMSITIDLEAIDPSVITKKIAKAHPIDRLGVILYHVFVFCFLFFVSFWIFTSIESIFSTDIEIALRTSFYFDSIRLWGMTLFSAIMVFGFLPMMFADKFFKEPLTRKQRNTYFLGMFLGTFLLFFHIHSIFIWAS